MRSKFINLVDYVIKILLVLVSVYFISSLIYNSKHLPIPANVLMWSMIVFIAIDCLMYIYGNYKENVLENKIIRGCVWAVAVCSCDIKGILVLLIITLAFFMFLSQEKRRILDIPCTFMISCICMECVSIIGLLFDGEYQYIGNLLNNSLAIDILLIVSVVLYISSDKITSVIVKIPSIEKNKVIDNNDTEQVLEKDKKAIYVSIALVGIILGLHIYSSFCINIAATHILICSVIIMLQIGVLYAIFNEVFIDLDKIYKLIIAIGAVCLPYINYNNYDMNKSLIYLFVFALLLCILKLLSKYKFKWAIAVAIIIVQTVLLFMQGVYIIPLINVLVGILLRKIIQKKYYSVIIVSLLFIMCSQIIVENKLISPIKVYDGIIETCYNIEEKMNVDIYYVGADAQIEKVLYNDGVACQVTEYNNINTNGIIIFDKNVEEKYIMHKYIVHEDDKFVVCFNDEELAMEYEDNGGSYTRKECSALVNVEYNNKTHTAKIVISGVTEGFHDIAAAIWSEENDQDDKEWYDFKLLEDGNYEVITDLSKHLDGGKINIHVYGSFENEDSGFVTGVTYDVNGN